MRKITILLILAVTGVLVMCTTNELAKQEETISIEALIEQGDYSLATEMIKKQLKNTELSAEERRSYLFEIERLDRVRKDFKATRDEVLSFIKEYCPQVTEADMSRWEASRALEFKMIDGKKLYFNRAARNLFRIDPEMIALWNELHPEDEITSGSGAKLNLDVHNTEIIETAISTRSTHVIPKRLRIKQSVEIDANTVPAGELVKCWIPYPRHIPGRQEDIVLLKSMPMKHVLAPEEVLQRTIFMEAPSIADEALKFTVEYEMTNHGVFHNINADSVHQLNPDPDLAKYLVEDAPHIVFSPKLRELSERIVGDEKNPYLQAQLLFAWVDNNTPWASAREYSSIQCIPEYAYENGHGDCGIQTLLFMTLCRMNGIPTRWQSGWELQPPDDSMHDWGMIYFEPYGWVPMDVTYGLRKSDDPRLKWFYLGGMDSYRIIFNDAYSQPFYPEKTHFRSETVDSQRGEIEWSGGNLYFDEWSWDFDWEVLE